MALCRRRQMSRCVTLPYRRAWVVIRLYWAKRASDWSVLVAAVGAGRVDRGGGEARSPYWGHAAPLPVVARPAQRGVGPVDTTRDSVSFVELRSMSRDGLVVYIRVDGSSRHCRLGLLFKRCRRLLHGLGSADDKFRQWPTRSAVWRKVTPLDLLYILLTDTVRSQ